MWVDSGNRTTSIARLLDDLPEPGSGRAVVARAPGRVNLIGEHTDYNAGLCLPVALPHETYAVLVPRSDDRVVIHSRQADGPWTGRLDELGPGGVTGWAAYPAGVLWALREAGVEVPGVELHIDSTVPLGAGLSSSAAVECAVAVAAVTAAGIALDDDLRRRLVAACVRAETEVAGAPTGGMDQTISLLAEAGHALLLDFRDDSTTPVAWGRSAPALLVVDTRVSHALTDGGYGSRRADCEAAVATLGVASLREATPDQVEGLADARQRARARHVVTEIARVQDAVAAIRASDWPALGSLMDASHVSMRDDFEISTDELDLVVSAAQAAGAHGARMTGGGFGGSAIVLVDHADLERVAETVATAFADADLGEPGLLRVVPSAGASLLS